MCVRVKGTAKLIMKVLELVIYLDVCKFVGLKALVCCPEKTALEDFVVIPKSKSATSISADESMVTHYQIYIIHLYVVHL